MANPLLIVPTKNRLQYINALVQNVGHQFVPIDIFVGDMSTDPTLLKNDWFLNAGIEWYKKVLGRSIVIQRVEGHNQLAGYQAGLEYALKHGYDLCIGGDDDIQYDSDWFEKGVTDMEDNPNWGILVGYTLLPIMSIEEQTAPQELQNHPDYQGRLKECGFYHMTMIDPRLVHPGDFSVRKSFEQVFGGFWFHAKDAEAVGGFPTYLSPFGFRGEMILQTCIHFLGKPLVLNPFMWSFHYSANTGGLREVQGELKKRGLEHDLKIWNAFLERGTPSTSRPEGV